MKRPQTGRPKHYAPRANNATAIPFTGTEVPTQAEFLAAVEPMAVNIAIGAKGRFVDAAPIVAAFGRMMAAAGAYRVKYGSWPLPTGPWVFDGKPFAAVAAGDLWRMSCWTRAIEVLAGVDAAAEGARHLFPDRPKGGSR